MNDLLEQEPVSVGEPAKPPSIKVLTTSAGAKHLVYRGSRKIVSYFLHLPHARVYDAGRTLCLPVTREAVMCLEVMGGLEEADETYVATVKELLQPSQEALSYYPTPKPGAPAPRPHQLAAFGWALDAIFAGRKGFVNACTLGSGKTRMAIDLMRHFGQSRSLVIGQKTTLEQWQEQLATAWPEAESFVLHQQGTVEQRKFFLLQLQRRETPPYQVILVNWETIALLEKTLKKFPKFDLIIADEASRLLGRTTAMARAAKGLAWRHAWYAIAMTGTPIRRSVEDVFSLFQFVDGSVFGSRIADFRERYCDLEVGGIKAEAVPKPERVVELVTKFYSAGYRVSRAAVDMPEPERRVVRLEPSAEQKRELDRINGVERQLKRRAPKEDLPPSDADIIEREDATNVLARILRQQQVTAGFVMAPHDAPASSWDGEHEEVLVPRYLDNPKLDWIMQYLDETWETEDGKFLIWTRFIPEIVHLHQRFVDRWGSDVVARLDGSTPDARRQEIRRAVNDRLNPLRVLACNLQTGAMGLDLPGIDVMFYHSSTFNYVDRVQSEGRGTRLGRKKPCQVIDLLLTGTIDEDVAEVLANKQSVHDLLVGQGFRRLREDQ